jgi:hypothetical protein
MKRNDNRNISQSSQSSKKTASKVTEGWNIVVSSGIPVVNSQTPQAIFSNVNINHEVVTGSLIDNLEKPQEFLKSHAITRKAPNANDQNSSDSDFESPPQGAEIAQEKHLTETKVSRDFPSEKFQFVETQETFIEFFKNWKKQKREYFEGIYQGIDSIRDSKLQDIKDAYFHINKTKYRKAIIDYFYENPGKNSLQQNLGLVQDLNNKVVNEEGQFEKIKISDKFLMVQFRGIHYDKKVWNDKIERYANYKEKSIDKPIFSKAVYAAANLQYCQRNLGVDEKELLLKEANTLKELLLKMREDKDIKVSYYDRYGGILGEIKYAQKADAMSNLFSANVDQFVKAMQDRKFGNEIKDKFKAEIPYVATGDIPYHALKYAYGIKPYSKKANESMLLPDSKSSIQSDFCFKSGLHVGKVFLSLHPLTDFDEKNGVVQTIEKANAEKFYLDHTILQEQETSFFAYIPEGRVIKEFVAKYPAFRGKYNDSYLYKYGLDEQLFNEFKKIFFVNDNNKKNLASRLLGDYLCCYQEIKFIYEALNESHKKEKILIFKDGKHKFSLYPVDQNQIQNNKPPFDFKQVCSINLNSSRDDLAESQNPVRVTSNFVKDNKSNTCEQKNTAIDFIAPNVSTRSADLKENKILEMSNEIHKLQIMNKKLEEQVKTLECIIEKGTVVKDIMAKVITTQAAIRGFFYRKSLERETIMKQGYQMISDLSSKRKIEEILELGKHLKEDNLLEASKAIKRFKGDQDDTPNLLEA